MLNNLNMVDHFRKVQKRVRSRTNSLRKITLLFFYCNHVFSSMNKTWMNKFESLLNRAKLVYRQHQVEIGVLWFSTSFYNKARILYRSFTDNSICIFYFTGFNFTCQNINK